MNEVEIKRLSKIETEVFTKYLENIFKENSISVNIISEEMYMHKNILFFDIELIKYVSFIDGKDMRTLNTLKNISVNLIFEKQDTDRLRINMTLELGE